MYAHINEEELEEFIYKISFIVQNGWIRYKNFYRDFYGNEVFEYKWKHSVHGVDHDLETAFLFAEQSEDKK